jgi:hypothetical protein
MIKMILEQKDKIRTFIDRTNKPSFKKKYKKTVKLIKNKNKTTIRNKNM